MQSGYRVATLLTDAKTFEPMCMSPLIEVAVERTRTVIFEVATGFTVVFNVQA